MVLPRAARERADSQRAAAEADFFAAALIDALERPDVREAVVAAVAGYESRRAARNPLAVTSARDLRAQRVRGIRG